MVALLPLAFKPVIAHKNAPVSAKLIAAHDAVLLFVNEAEAPSLLATLPHGDTLLNEYLRLQRRGPVSCIRLHVPGPAGAALWCGFAKSNASAFEQLQLAGRLCKDLSTAAVERVALATIGFAPDATLSLLNALLAATLARCAPLPSYKRQTQPVALKAISLLHAADRSFNTTLATQQGNHLARWFTTLPPNELNCDSYRKALQQLAKREGWQSQFMDMAALKKLGAGAFLAVARANASPGAGILRLRYRCGRKSARTLALVGKGICFDTGGINLKSHKGMYDMHTDMQGSAVAVGTLLALSQLKAPMDVDCWVALTENEIGPNAYRPQEVITAANGMTIQVVHSDAEGRMALADTLHLAAQSRPALLLDFATLTGACVAALTERMSGAFTNRDELRAVIETAGRHTGERVWTFPMDADFDSDLDSPLADIMQCTLDNKGDHILAARFLNHFVPGTVPWVHVDLSSASRTGGLAHIPTEITGFGVRFAVELIARQLMS